MALRGKKPELIQKRLKALWYGPAGCGKTTAAIQMPRPYLIDTEKGAENDQYVQALKKVDGLYWHTTDPDELIDEIRNLISEKHAYATVIIDPLTIIYNDLLDKAADEVGTDFGRHKGPADRKIKHLLQLLLRLDMNVVITSHSKPKWVRAKDSRGRDTVCEDGQTYDCYTRLDYLFDLVFEVRKHGNERVGVVRKTRLDSFPEGEFFPFTYSEIANRYGRSILERDAVPVILASADQVAMLEELLAQRKNGDELRAKWLDKAEAETLAELPAEAAEKCIAYLGGLAASAPRSEANNSKKEKVKVLA
jgi:hypothetical protein